MKSSLFAAGLVLVAGTVSAHGAILQWDALFNGSASTANNWNPNQVPTAADDLRFNSVLNNNYTVTYDSLVPTVRSHQYLGDNVTIQTTFPHSIASTMSIDNGSEILLEAATLHVEGTTTIGATSGLGGSLTIDQSLFTSQQLHLGAIGPGDVIVGNAGRLEVSTVTLRRGSSLALQDSAIAELSSLTIGSIADPDASSVLVSDGSDMTLLGGITLSPVAGSSSVLQILDGPDSHDTRITARGDVLIAANSTAAAAGNATVVAGHPSEQSPVLDCDDLIVGDANGGNGTLTIDGGMVFCNSATFVPGHSTLALRMGRLDCRGAFNWTGGTLVVNSAYPSVEALLGIGGAADLTAPVLVGTDSGGTIFTSSGAARINMRSGCDLGQLRSGEGRLRVHTPVEVHVTGPLNVGLQGIGLCVVFGHCDADEIRLALNSTSTGTLEMAGGGTCIANNGLWVGGGPTVAGGTGVVTATEASTLTVQGGMRIWGGGTVALDHSSLSSGAVVATSPGAAITLTEGQITAPQMTLTGSSTASGDGVDITGSGTVDAAISATGFGNNVTAGGSLFIGKSTSTTGFSGANIAIDVGSNTVTLRDANAAVIGDTSIAAGTIAAPNGITVSGTRTISGGGTIDAPTISNSGTINATTPQGFVVKGIVSGAGSLTGTLFDFSNTGGFSGSGTINSQIRGSAGSIITSTGALSLGTASSVGFSFDGTLSTGANTITLHDTSTAFVGNIELAGGTVFCSDTDMTSDLNDVTSGFGTIGVTPRTWINAGIIRPSGSGADATGQISVAGNLNAENVFNSAVFDLDIGGTSNTNIDRFVVVGALTIDGTLRVRFVPGYVPAGGEVYTVITANSVTGNFTTLNLPPRTRMIQNSTSIQIEALCPADYNGDGGVDGDDVIDFFAAWDAGDSAADFNGDGGVDGDDVIGFFERWDSGC